MNKSICYQAVVFFIFLFIALLGFAYFSPDKADVNRDLKVYSLFGTDFSLSAVKQPYVLHFFASWCKSCALDHAVILKYKDALPLYAVGSLDNPDRIKTYLAKYQNPYIDVIEDSFGSIAKYFNVSALPETIVIKDNKVIIRIKGPITLNDLEKKIIPLFKNNP